MVASGGEFKIVFDAMASAQADVRATAGHIADSADEQLHRMQNTLGSGWGDEAAEESFQAYQLRQKETGYHVDGLNAEGTAYGNVEQIGQQTLGQAVNIVRNI
jgi:uncharacterized protein YukE